jgi:hypothetical protein
MSSVKAMIEIECKAFHGDRNGLAKYLRERLKADVRVERNVLRIQSGDQPNARLSIQDVKDVVKRALHHMGMDEYHVITQEGILSIRERKTHERYAKSKGSVPSARQTVPYFFPG